ncbi:hypothetical protein SB00610_00872 [Klebsiella quasipneumoniae subsp. similipneumoniae]|nr:hypothetical protein SB00610_00872 [Klebsiella quasipneumoniae subsp. similipneumoniae]
MGLHNRHFFAIDGKAVGFQRLRDVYLRRRAVFHLWSPVRQLCRFGGCNMFNHFRRGDHFRLREGFHQRLKAKIEVRIAGGDHNPRQRFAVFLDHVYQLFAVFDAELGVKQHRFMRAGNEGGVDGKKTFLLRVVSLQRQRRREDRAAEQGGGNSKSR